MQAVQNAIENVVGKTALAEDGEHDGAQPVALGAFIWSQACFLPHFFPGAAE